MRVRDRPRTRLNRWSRVIYLYVFEGADVVYSTISTHRTRVEHANSRADTDRRTYIHTMQGYWVTGKRGGDQRGTKACRVDVQC